jgi:hypothetical protein
MYVGRLVFVRLLKSARWLLGRYGREMDCTMGLPELGLNDDLFLIKKKRPYLRRNQGLFFSMRRYQIFAIYPA